MLLKLSGYQLPFEPEISDIFLPRYFLPKTSAICSVKDTRFKQAGNMGNLSLWMKFRKKGTVIYEDKIKNL